jgi:hypothetical protein
MAAIQVKRGLVQKLPPNALPGEPIFTLDTYQLFIGTGDGLKEFASKEYVDAQLESRKIDAGTF